MTFLLCFPRFFFIIFFAENRIYKYFSRAGKRFQAVLYSNQLSITNGKCV